MYPLNLSYLGLKFQVQFQINGFRFVNFEFTQHYPSGVLTLFRIVECVGFNTGYCGYNNDGTITIK